MTEKKTDILYRPQRNRLNQIDLDLILSLAEEIHCQRHYDQRVICRECQEAAIEEFYTQNPTTVLPKGECGGVGG